MRSALVTGISLLCFGVTAEAEPCTPAKEKLSLSFQGVSVAEVIEFFSVVTCKRFILPDKLNNLPIYLSSQSPLSVEEAYLAFEVSLEASGLSLVPEGKFLKIVKADAPSQKPLKTEVFSIRYGDANELVRILEALFPAEGRLFSYSPTNALIVSGSDSFLERVHKLITPVGDTPPATNPTSQLLLFFLEGKQQSLYQLSMPKEGAPSRLELRTPSLELFIELTALKESGVIQYQIKRKTHSKEESSTISLSGLIQLPASGEVTLMDASDLGLRVSLLR